MPTRSRSSRLGGRLAAALLSLLAAAACAPPAPASAPAGDAAGAERARSVACTVPVAPGTLVDVREVDPTIRVRIPYATAENFTGAPLPGYEVPRALLRPDAAQALARVQDRLREQGLGLKVWDAYRPVRATLAMVEWAERTGNEWVLEEGYVARRSGHNQGATVDVTLVRLDGGEALDMGTGYDEFTAAAHTANAGGAVWQNRVTLLRAMEAEGFQNYELEWWHFSLPGRREPLDVPIGCF